MRAWLHHKGAAYEPPEAQTRYFREKYRPPFVKAIVSGKRTPAESTPLQKVALSFAFPLFLGRAVIDPEGAAPPKWASEMPAEMANDPTIQRQMASRARVRRRFSGDPHNPIPRGRYVALVGASTVTPAYSLLGEMNAYALPFFTGYCAAVPVAGRDEICVRFRGLPGEPNPLRRFVTEPQAFGRPFDALPWDPRSLLTPAIAASVPAANEFQVAVPIDDVHTESERVFDMRLPEARRWMIEFFRNPPPVETDDDLAHGGFLQILAEMYRVDLSRIVGWRELLPIVSTPAQGGNAMTDLFAAFLRRMGCTGIIFPSARSDHGVVIVDGRVQEHWGWLFVDFAGSPAPTRLSPQHEQPAPPLMVPYHVAEIENGRLAGSLAVIGCSLNTRWSLQMQFDQFALGQGPTLPARKPASLQMRSYSWFRRDYVAGPQAVWCGACETLFPYREVGPLRQCPACAFRGDLGELAYVHADLVPHLKEV